MSGRAESADLIEPWIYSRLTGDPDFAALGVQVHGALTPDDPGPLYAIISALSPPRDVRGIGTVTLGVDSVYLIKAVGQTTSQDDLLPVARRIFDLFGGVDEDAPGGHITCVREAIVSYAEVTGAVIGGGQAFLHLGGQFRIRAT